MIDSSKVLPVGTVLRSGSRAYTITEVLGQGGFGITYSATYATKINGMRVKVVVALKEFFLSADCERDGATGEVTTSTTARERTERAKKDFIGEAQRLKALSGKHNNIISVSEVFEANNTAYYVMEYVEGESLDAYVKSRGALSESETMTIMCPIIEAVAFLHGERITHLDIKPGNIMLSTDDNGNLRPVLIDFGLSKHYNADGSPTSTLNSMGYSEGYSPIEQYAGIREFSPASDVYSLGATMLFALTGRTPVSAANIDNETLRRAVPVGLQASTVAAITEAMRYDRKHRPENAGALLAMLTNGDNTRNIDVDPIIPEICTEPNPNTVPESNATATSNLEQKSKSNSNNGYLYILMGAVASVAILIILICSGYSEFGEPKEDPKVEAMMAAPAPAPPALSQEDLKQMELLMPHHLDLAVRYDGERGYFSSDEWTSLSSADKSKYRKIGMVVSAKGQRFIVELNDKEGGREMEWDEAMDNYSTVMPTYAQGEALASIDWDTWESKMNAYGGDVTKWFWTNEERNSSYAWVVHMVGGIVSNGGKSNTCRVRAVAPVI